jgi:hypothetical protein
MRKKLIAAVTAIAVGTAMTTTGALARGGGGGHGGGGFGGGEIGRASCRERVFVGV